MATMRNALHRIRSVDPTIPADIVGTVLLLVVLDALVFRTTAAAQYPRTAIGVAVVLFVPGYLVLASVYPRQRAMADLNDPVRSKQSAGQFYRIAHGNAPSWWERVYLSVGLSVAIVPLLGLLVTPITGSLSADSVLLALNVFVLLGSVTALVRRNMVPVSDRLSVPFSEVASTVSGLLDGESYADRALSTLFVLAIVVMAATMGYVVFAPGQGETYTSTALLTETQDGDFVASGYPDTVDPETGEQLALRVENNEGAETTYTAVAVLQRVDTSDQSTSITESERVFSAQQAVAPGETWTAEHRVQPTMTGEDLRLRYFVYRGEPPAEVTEETAYRTLSLWLSVSAES
ncbi:MAG: DUF1616 domain-containing protein [Halapricum sp.]